MNNHQQNDNRAFSATDTLHQQGIELDHIISPLHANFLKELDLCKESERRRTYEHWPSKRPTVDIQDLAKSGFFYLGNLNRVQCFSCGGVLELWKYDDHVDSRHRSQFPHCLMTKGTETQNIEITNEEQSNVTRTGPTYQEPPVDPSDEQAAVYPMTFLCNNPSNPYMVDEERRFASFNSLEWNPTMINPTPRKFAEAGFFYFGEPDHVKCWYCNGGIQNWNCDEDPWFQHAKWFPKCEFVLQQKSPEFVQMVVAKFPNIPRPNMPNTNGLHPLNLIKHVENALKSKIGKTALEMDLDEKAVKHAIKRHIQTHGEMYMDVDELVNDVTEKMDLSDSSSDDDTTSATESMLPSSTAENDTLSNLLMELNNMISSIVKTALEMGFKEEQILQTVLRSYQEVSELVSDLLRDTDSDHKVAENSATTPPDTSPIGKNCKICLDQPMQVVFLPCGHICACKLCGDRVLFCPICREKIERRVQFFEA